jgi:hypothetical protein
MTPKTQAQLLNDLLDGLNQMIGAASCIIHHHQDMRWYFIRKILEEVQDATVKQCVNPLTAPKVTRHERKTQVVV